MAFGHLFDALTSGAKFIRETLRAVPPDLNDRYHKQFANLVEEMRIASGLPKVNPYIIPSFAINSMALMEKDKTPTVIVTEGMLSDSTRDELQAVVAHELAHLIRGDTVFLTLICSLTNVFEKLKSASKPMGYSFPRIGGGYPHGGQGSGGMLLVHVAALLSSGIMFFLTALISRRRELMADAMAVEFTRNPKSLARIIYKAHLKYSFVGDFSENYGPLFVVNPYSRGEGGGFFANLFNSHPSIKKRLGLLGGMAGSSVNLIVEEVWEIHRKRDASRGVLKSFDEVMGMANLPIPISEPLEGFGTENIWEIRNSRGEWKGPFGLGEILFLPFFTPRIRMRNLESKEEGAAQEFGEVRQALGKLGEDGYGRGLGENKCCKCQSPLTDDFYEGVPIKVCKKCGGKLVEAASTSRIISRKEFAFSETLIKKAEQLKEEIFLNPLNTDPNMKPGAPNRYLCPGCGSRMMTRPFTYQYFVPVEKCLACHKIWFDTDELEILQILIENKGN